MEESLVPPTEVLARTRKITCVKLRIENKNSTSNLLQMGLIVIYQSTVKQELKLEYQQDIYIYINTHIHVLQYILYLSASLGFKCRTSICSSGQLIYR